LYDKIFACLAASRIASAMGAAVEGWSMEKIAERYGVFDKLIAYHHYNVDWDHPAGSTEDGIERQKLMCTAIIEKQDPHQRRRPGQDVGKGRWIQRR